MIAPFFRYVIGETLEATGGSLLAAGILHASFNATGSLGFPGGWQFLPALLVMCHRDRRRYDEYAARPPTTCTERERR